MMMNLTLDSYIFFLWLGFQTIESSIEIQWKPWKDSWKWGILVLLALLLLLLLLVVACVLAFQQGNTGLVPPAGPPKPLSVMPMEAMKGATKEISLVDWSPRFSVSGEITWKSIEGRNYPIGVVDELTGEGSCWTFEFLILENNQV